MASDSAKTQLLAIYKLEFYKNKKNWKLYENVRKEPLPSPDTPHKLNKTYNVGEELPKSQIDEEPVSPHNKAFLYEESDTPDPQPPDYEPPSPDVLDSNLYRARSWSEQLYDGDGQVPVWRAVQQEWCGVEAEGIPEQLAYDQCDGPWQQHQLWAPASDYSLKPAVDPLDMQSEYLTPAQMLATAEEWLLLNGYPLLQQEYASSYEDYGFLDDSCDFMRGAHQVPHSSEIDLSISQDCLCVCKDTVCALSMRQLVRAIQRHHAALTLLLREQALRDRLSALSRTIAPLPFEECPTRDTDPLRPADAVLAASHDLHVSHVAHVSHVPHDVGRGRGRLLQARRMLSVGPGRPGQL
ncbi:hypothetical protein PYW08_011075 [Mythimna loreyi]|uniref:Uncharacterized protein n=1 Tax=Mythimna loreyi TaxID=667449 RepID=A0ACC2Q2I5_9NEOP|nr:hypothetical protein PYW08_011075 [Mythimna loreyi]